MDDRPAEDAPGFAALLVRLGLHTSGSFARHLAPLGLEPRHAAVLLARADSEGLSQQAVGERLGLTPTRMVFLIDELEQRGLAERRRNEADRRSYGLYLTAAGRKMITEVRAARGAHHEQLGASLSPAERLALTGLLQRLATEQGLTGSPV